MSSGDHFAAVGLVLFHVPQPCFNDGFGCLVPMRYRLRQQGDDNVAGLRHILGDGMGLKIPHGAGHAGRELA